MPTSLPEKLKRWRQHIEMVANTSQPVSDEAVSNIPSLAVSEEATSNKPENEDFTDEATDCCTLTSLY